MDRRLKLQSLLENIQGVRKVYFQPPNDISLEYPCIVYQRDRRWVEYADNGPYVGMKRYQLTVIDSDPDSPIPDKVATLPRTAFLRFFKAERLNHDIFNIYF